MTGSETGTDEGVEGRGSWELVAAAQSGDAEAFGSLYRRYVAVVARYIGRRVGSAAVVEDLTSDTFVRAWERIHLLRKRDSDVDAWLIMIARNLIFDHAKKHATRREVAMDVLPEPRAGERFGGGVEDEVLERLHRDAVASAVVAQLRALPVEQRLCLYLRYWRELPFEHVGPELARSSRAARTVRHRALKTLRRRLEAPAVAGAGTATATGSGEGVAA